MASSSKKDEHKRLAGYIKTVHADLRKRFKKGMYSFYFLYETVIEFYEMDKNQSCLTNWVTVPLCAFSLHCLHIYCFKDLYRFKLMLYQSYHDFEAGQGINHPWHRSGKTHSWNLDLLLCKPRAQPLQHRRSLYIYTCRHSLIKYWVTTATLSCLRSWHPFNISRAHFTPTSLIYLWHSRLALVFTPFQIDSKSVFLIGPSPNLLHVNHGLSTIQNEFYISFFLSDQISITVNLCFQTFPTGF